MFLAVSCAREDVIESNDPSTGRLQFSPNLEQAQTVTRAGESDNDVLRIASAAGMTGSHIVIDTYTGTPGTSLKPYFSDKLGYFETGNYWDINSGIIRFLPEGGMNLYAHYATKYPDKGDLTNVIYTKAAAQTAYPKLTFTVAAQGASQVDLIAAKVENITHSEVSIPLRHILSQINFGVKGIDQHQITVKNIRINGVKNTGSFDYNTWQWSDNKGSTNYSYYFPDRKEGEAGSGIGTNYQTLGVENDSQNNYLFGDGGKFGPGKEDTFLYAQPAPATSAYATQENTTTSLHNSLMLLPQQITQNADAIVTFDYEMKHNGHTVQQGTNSTVQLNVYQDWQPNMRYAYLFKFDDPAQITFDVLIEPWYNYDGDDGIVDSEELTATTLFEKYVRPLKANDKYIVPIGTLTSDFICDWSLYTVDNSFAKDQQFTLSFEDNVPFTNGKSIIITPPFGFRASTSKLRAKGDVIFTAIHSYFPTAAALNAALSNSGEVGNHEFSVRDEVKLGDINFLGSATAESSLTLHYLTAQSGDTPPKWQMYNDKTAVLFPNTFALTSSSLPYSYTVYNVQGLKAVFDWMTIDGKTNPGGNNSTATYAQRMQTNINLALMGRYNLADVYKSTLPNSNPAYVPIGNFDTPYSGIFDGKGATVENLYIFDSKSGTFMGFFGVTSNKVQNLRLNNVSIVAQSFVGGITGLQAGGSIVGCSVSGSLSGWTTGGIAGKTWNLMIYACYSTATVAGGECDGIAYDYDKNKDNDYDNYYVSSSDIGTSRTRVPSIAVLNGKTPLMNTRLSYLSHNNHYKSGDLDVTTPMMTQGAPSPKGGGILKGTFIQNWFALGWNEIQWNTEIALLASLGMEYLVIDQVMECHVPDPPIAPSKYMAWYPASASVIANDESPALEISSGLGTALEMCMKACRAHGIKLFIGTFFDKRYWNDGVAVKGKEAQWNNCITTANRVMNELTTFYFSGASSTKGNYDDVLAGWYFPYEVDDLSFQTTEAQTTLKNGIRSAMNYRTALANANKPYLFSPFMNGASSPVKNTMNATEYAALWRDIITDTGFKSGDILSPQDCIGAGKLTIGELATWMPALKGAASAVTGVEFWINVEIFGPGADISFLTQQQIVENKKYTNKLISFSYPIYYSPTSGYRKGDHKAYKAYYDAQ